MSARYWLIVLCVLVVGCDYGERARRQATANNLRQIGEALQNYHDSSAQPAPNYSHVVTADSEYYTTGPQQGRPADGTFEVGTKVKIVEAAGSYALVRSAAGVEAYISAEAVKALDDLRLTDVVESGNRFAIDLYRQLSGSDGNLFFSPTSISTALSMAYAGAATGTKEEMGAALHLDQSDALLHDRMRALQASWHSTDEDIKLHLANRLWGQESYEFLPDYLAITRDGYGAGLARLDFTQTEQARQAINAWVEDHTEKKIVDLIPAGAPAADTKLILTNAVYFYGGWQEPFKESLTHDGPFHLSATEKVNVPLMHCWEELRYGEDDNVQIVELPYGKGDLSMVVLLPKAATGLADLEADLTFDSLTTSLTSLKPNDEVEVYLPKFTMTSRFELAGVLRSLGMESAFTAASADFTGMTGGRDLYLSAVIHKAFVDVNEEGTEAAAATAVLAAPASAVEEQKPPVFRADHPFLFLIRDNRNGAILFLGRVVDPRDAE